MFIGGADLLDGKRVHWCDLGVTAISANDDALRGVHG
jgi:hypothetical protein